jgi:hypothetical protein
VSPAMLESHGVQAVTVQGDDLPLCFCMSSFSDFSAWWWAIRQSAGLCGRDFAREAAMLPDLGVPLVSHLVSQQPVRRSPVCHDLLIADRARGAGCARRASTLPFGEPCSVFRRRRLLRLTTWIRCRKSRVMMMTGEARWRATLRA